MTKLELLQLQNEHRERNYEDEYYNTPLTEEEKNKLTQSEKSATIYS